MTWTSNTYAWNSNAGVVRYYYYATVEENTVYEDANTSNITIKFYARGAYDPQYEGYTTYYEIYMDGSLVKSGNGPTSLGTSYTQIGSKNITVPHNEDGTYSFQLGVKLYSNSTASYLPYNGIAYLSPKCGLTTINRGLMHVNVSGTWESGRPYVNVNGTWYGGQAFVNNNGTWERGV